MNEYVYAAVDAAGDVYVSIAGDHPSPDRKTIYVARSSDDGVTWSDFVPVAEATQIGACCLPNTTFRDGILEHFAASPDYPGHLYTVWEDWDGSQYDVKFSQSTDFGRSWSAPIVVNDNANRQASDQFQPQVAAGPGGAVAVNFYDRRATCPNDPSILPEHVGRRTSASTRHCRRSRTPVRARCRSAATCACRSSRGTPSSPGDDRRDRPDGVRGAHRPVRPRAFIGDYFGLAISEDNVYTLAVSTHYPSRRDR